MSDEGSLVMQWYVISAKPNYELRVKKTLEERIHHAGLEEKFGKILVPTEMVEEVTRSGKRKSESKFFPGYVLVEMQLDEDTWHLVRNCPRVHGFVGGTSDRPTPLSEIELDRILKRVKEGGKKPKPKKIFEPGDSVRVKEGPFADFNGVVEEVNYEKSRLKVAVLIFGRSTPLELEFSQVEKA